ncbi:MAG: 4-hydroxythreonine-4-phosphate dehydrogenase PdxA [Bacteroidales bacterium]|jgi:4-hydroxythreonine-4-phosphate dehydrogenase|nr:4-hydroxythreonine-4-phosphate dehydrogenase PdxA [Bacteroidales bacterium]
MEDQKIKIGITHGDINGVSYEVVMKTFAGQSKMTELCTPILYGSPKVLSYYRNVLDVKQLTTNTISSAEKIKPDQLNIVNCIEGEIKVDIGQSTIQAGDCTIKALDKAIEEKKAGFYDVMVTAPLNKENVQKCLPTFSGHTEYLQEKFASDDVLMMMVKDQLRVAVATTHIPVSQIAESISPEIIEKKIKLLDKSLLEDFTIRKGRIAVLGLNPHSGDNGAIGTEDRDIITPTLNKLKNEGFNAFGPFPADGFFGSGEYTKYDAILAMYHDQGLVPFKLLAEGGGVNFTAGLPIVRTSPAHGTAYGIAGQNKANEQSFRDAIYLGIDIYRNRKIYQEASAKPLKSQENNRRQER